MKKIYFFNAANFPYAEIDLSKRNIFFVGDNGSGKTTAIRAIHFFYNSDVKSLGIDTNKESFKKFYFKYDNSFIVYEFDEFFVLMYKKRGEIKKIFSKKKFNLKEIDINDLSNVLNYAKNAEIKFIPSTIEEYKKVLYGLDRRYFDFKLTTIKNYNTFINLYNKIFNVNKAVFDASSIKEVIFTTLDRVESGKIDYENFLNEISLFRQYFIFYNKFKMHSANIEKLYFLKNDLISLDKELQNLLAKIAYKKDIELKEIDEIIKDLNKIESRINKKRKQFNYFNKKISFIEEKINKKILKLKSLIEDIKRLKNKFNLETIQQAKKEILIKDELENRLIVLKTSLNELLKGIKNQVEEVNEEIERLKREKRVLNEKLKEEEIILKRNLEEIYEEKIEKLKETYLLKEKEFLNEIEIIEKEIENNLSKKEGLKKELNDIKNKFFAKKDRLKKDFEIQLEEIKKQKIDIKNKIDDINDEIYDLKRKLKNLNKDYKEQQEEIIKNYEIEIKEINNKIKFFNNILKTIPNSFKEFLNQNVENWEEDLYPIIDKNLLSMDIKELSPKIISSPICGLKIKKDKLETIPTMSKAEEEIKRFEILKESLKNEKEEKLSLLAKDFESKKIEISSLIEFNEEKIEELKNELKNLDNKINIINQDLNKDLKKLDNLEKEEIKLIQININKLDEVNNNLKKEIDNVRFKIKRLFKERKNEINTLLNEKQKEFKIKKDELIKNYEKEKIEIDKKIDNLTSKKNSISKDERIKDIQNEIENIEEKLKLIQQKEAFLKEYEEKKEFINSLKEKEKQLEKLNLDSKRIKEFSKTLFKKLESKLALLENQKNEFENKLEIIKKGLDEVKRLTLPNEKRDTNEYLKNLIEDYKIKLSIFRDKKSEFKDVASDIRSALMNFSINGLDVNFNIENLSNLILEELEKIDELYLFKNKKFEVLKKAKMKELKNLLDGLLDKKIEGFERSKEEFLTQVKKINNNLSKIDFGIVKNIKIDIEESKKNILKIFENIRNLIEDLLTLLQEESLFFDKIESERKLKKIEEFLGIIKKEVGNESFSLVDIIDLSVKFIENGKENILKIIKNESSTGGSILLKIAIAVSLLELFIKEKTDLFLILDEVSVLSTKNQKLLKEFVNEKGLGVIYVTPDLPLVDVEDIDIYKFRNVNSEFEVIKLIANEGIKIEN